MISLEQIDENLIVEISEQEEQSIDDTEDDESCINPKNVEKRKRK